MPSLPKLPHKDQMLSSQVKNLSVLVVSGGSFQGLTVIKGLRYSDSVRVIMADSSYENVGKYFADRFYHVPEIGEGNAFLDSVLEICQKEHVGLIIPSTERELLPLAKNIELFHGNDIYVAVSSVCFLDVVTNKRALYTLLGKKGFPVLPMIDLTEASVSFPVLGKPVRGWGSRDIIVLNHREDMQKYSLSELQKKYLWQPYLRDFEEYSIDCAIHFDGRISEFVIRRRMRTVGGYAVIAESVDDPVLTDILKSFLDVLKAEGAKGILNIQVLKKGANYFFSDVNPRIGTSAVFSYRAGINFPLFLCSHLDPSIYSRPRDVRPGKLKMVRYLEELWIEKKAAGTFKGVVFDLDDTLINHKAWIAEKLERVWSLFNHVLPERHAFLVRALQIIEEGNRSNVFDVLSKEFGFSDSLRNELIDAYRKVKLQSCPTYADVLPTLTELKQRGLRLALVTDNPPITQKQKIKAAHFENMFDAVVYSRELGDDKPAKTAFEEAARLLGVSGESLAMVGDNLYRDIVGSLEARFKLAFWIMREGGFYNFEEVLFNRLFEHKYRFIKISDLRHLVWHLE